MTGLSFGTVVALSGLLGVGVDGLVCPDCPCFFEGDFLRVPDFADVIVAGVSEEIFSVVADLFTGEIGVGASGP